MFTDIITVLSRTLQEQDFSVAQIALLHLLYELDSPSKKIAQELEISASSMSRLTDQLVQLN